MISRLAHPLTSIAALALLPVACALPIEGDRTAWLQSKVSELESLAPGSPPRAILRTSFRGKTVYYVTPTCCDIPSELYDDRGSLLCRPSGGFAGGDGKCTDFQLEANAATVWRDQRPARTAAGAALPWTGKWLGPEGTFLEIADADGKTRITIRNLDGPRTFDGVRRGGRIAFERDGVSETIRAGSGADTGMKWLADKSDCLVVKPGEGYCR